MIIRADTPAYLRTWAEEISSRANRVRHLIGDAHWLADGTYKEFLIRELLTRHLPSHLRVSRGFIRPIHRSDACSPEVDLLVSDPSRHVPLFCEGELQIVTPSSVLATIEVKSTYSLDVLRHALRNVVASRATLLEDVEPERVWSAVLFANAGENFAASKLMDALVTLVNDASVLGKSRGSSGLKLASLLPSSIGVSGGALALIGNSDTGAGSCQIRVFETPDLAFALAIAQLFAHVQAQLRPDNGPGELDDVLRSFEIEPKARVIDL